MLKKLANVLCMIVIIGLAAGCGAKKQETKEEKTIKSQEGTVILTESDQFILETAEEEKMTFKINDDTVDITTKGKIAKGDYVTVVYVLQDSENLATDVSYAERTAQGTVSSVNENEFTITSGEDELALQYDEDTLLNLENQIIETNVNVIVTYISNVQGNKATAVTMQQEETTQE